MGRIAALVLLAAVMTVVCILTWGSLGSAVMLFGLVMMGSGLLYQKFMTNRDEDDFNTGE